MEAYFIVYLTTGSVLSFNRLCNRVVHSASNLCRFMHDGSDNGETCLALIPYDKILYIERKEETKI